MTNPWLKKNPFMSMWMSGANTVAGHVNAQAKRQVASATKTAANEMWSAWANALVSPPAARKKRR